MRLASLYSDNFAASHASHHTPSNHTPSTHTRVRPPTTAHNLPPPPTAAQVLDVTAKVCNWREEALRLRVSDDHEYGLPDESLEMQPPLASQEVDPWQARRR